MVPGKQTSPVAFVYLPFGAGYKPAIGVSLLKSALARIGVRADIHYLNLKFAELLGLDLYDLISCSLPGQLLVGEWLFSQALFGENSPADATYVEEILWKQSREIFSPAIVHALLQIRDRIPSFLDSCLADIDWSQYSLVGFSTVFQQQCSSLALAKLIKTRYPDLPILFGGSQCFGDVGSVLLRTFPFIDYVCTGEGDSAVPALVQAIHARDEVCAIPGILSRNDFLSPQPPSSREVIHDLNTIPFPDYSDYIRQIMDIDQPTSYEIHMLMETSRGCWWAEHSPCTFCGLNTDQITFRYKSPERALEEIRHIASTYGGVLDMTDTIMPTPYFTSLLPRLSSLSGLWITWEMRPHLSRNQFQLLKDAHVTTLVLGIESLNNSLFALMGKGTSLVQVIQSLKWAREYGIHIYWNLLWGFPAEEPDHYRDIIDLIPLLVHFDPPAHCARIHFDRWSKYWKDPSSYGIVRLSPSPVYALIYHPLAEEDLNDIAYFFDAEVTDRSSEYSSDLIRAVQTWLDYSDARLDMIDTGSELTIWDSRNPDNEVRYEFHGLCASVYRECDAARTIRDLAVCFQVEERELIPILNGFLNSGLMILSDERYLSLAVSRT